MGLNSIYLTLHLTVNKNWASRNTTQKVQNSASGIHIFILPTVSIPVASLCRSHFNWIFLDTIKLYAEGWVWVEIKSFKFWQVTHPAYSVCTQGIAGIHEHRPFVTGEDDGKPWRSEGISLFKKTSASAIEERSLMPVSGQPIQWDILSGQGSLCSASELDLGKTTVSCFILEPNEFGLICIFWTLCQVRGNQTPWVNCGTKHPLFLLYLKWADPVPLHIRSSESPKIQGSGWRAYFGPALGWECRVIASGDFSVSTKGTWGGKDFVFKIGQTWV